MNALACLALLAFPLVPVPQTCDQYHYADDGRLIAISPCEMLPTEQELGMAEDLVDRASRGEEVISLNSWRDHWGRDPPPIVIAELDDLVEIEYAESRACPWSMQWDQELDDCVDEVTVPRTGFLRVLDRDGNEVGLFQGDE